jgi:hypothetical protein
MIKVIFLVDHVLPYMDCYNDLRDVFSQSKIYHAFLIGGRSAYRILRSRHSSREFISIDLKSSVCICMYWDTETLSEIHCRTVEQRDKDQEGCKRKYSLSSFHNDDFESLLYPRNT